MADSATYSFPVRVYYEDTDFSGNVYHAAYLKFFERGRTEFLRDVGIHHFELAVQGLAFAVCSMQIEFLRTAHIDDLLTVTTEVNAITGARLVLRQQILRADTVLTEAEVVVASIRMSGGVARMPKQLLALLRSDKP
ncbi:YbgC/FadM family acyl-CoA thioesterase [Devosia rhodophyticola]|uniref:YbgC/FadM family acyl-CoA thioesterase n=1 Tax=Devosia rhodophyticola TaxID=3026423 RepID=A0ABY7YUQ2_9HYPH|nr:YbgC/FadM family acyl-CoA thioesterase [Devosia rhodophyticola]WDR04927.1 YbgC/FadM family acyl-CoA thioesterase [Devosia rhodophyticola]